MPRAGLSEARGGYIPAMGSSLSRGRTLDAGAVGLTLAELPPLPDTIRADRKAGWLDVRAWFGRRDAPLEIEIGSGKGTFLVQEAEARPGTNFLGIEYAHEFYAYAADRLRRRGLANVRLLYADAMEFLRWRTPDGAARVVHLYFPDPWPKARHHKRRMVQEGFIAEVHRVLATGGELRIVTDHADYWAWMEELFAGWCDPSREGPRFERKKWGEDARPGAVGEGEIVGTNFERKYRREGRPFFAGALAKQ